MRFFPAILLTVPLLLCSCDRQPLTISEPDENLPSNPAACNWWAKIEASSDDAQPIYSVNSPADVNYLIRAIRLELPTVPDWLATAGTFPLRDDNNNMIVYSAGPPPKTNYLIGAARLECLATLLNHYQAISKTNKNLPIIANLAQDRFQSVLELYQKYDRRHDNHYLAAQLQDLNNFLATGYQGELLPEFQKLRAEVERKLQYKQQVAEWQRADKMTEICLFTGAWFISVSADGSGQIQFGASAGDHATIKARQLNLSRWQKKISGELKKYPWLPDTNQDYITVSGFVLDNTGQRQRIQVMVATNRLRVEITDAFDRARPLDRHRFEQLRAAHPIFK